MMNEILKGERFQKVLGEFGEYLVMNWLARSGFAVARIDHVGIDIIASRPDPSGGEPFRIGISVKSRTRVRGTESDPMNILERKTGKDGKLVKDDRANILAACLAFKCEPWIAVYVETTMSADLYLTTLEHYDVTYRGTTQPSVDTWGMSALHRARYADDCKVRHIYMDFSADHWSW